MPEAAAAPVGPLFAALEREALGGGAAGWQTARIFGGEVGGGAAGQPGADVEEVQAQEAVEDAEDLKR
jgi:hypothetical protein